VSNKDAMQYIDVFLLLSLGIISCNSYAHSEDATQEHNKPIRGSFGCDARVSPHIAKCGYENCDFEQACSPILVVAWLLFDCGCVCCVTCEALRWS
jgi:hypothetical protein